MKRVGGRMVAPFCILLFLTLLHAGFTLWSHSLPGTGWRMFAPNKDFFADSLKSGLAETAISAPLRTDPRVAEWPETFRRYVYHNDYLKPGMSIDHSPPLSALVLMGVAGLLLWLSPWPVIGILTALYAAAAGAVARAAQRLAGARDRWLWPLIVGAYPSLFMLDRGNIHSGLTSACVIFYMLSAFHGRWKGARWLALAFAVNLRPNVAIFALMEMYRSRTRREGVTGMVAAGLLSVGLLLLAFVVVQGIDPHYSFASFRSGYALYTRNYVEGIEGLRWNGSLFNAVKTLRFLLAMDPLYSPVGSTALSWAGIGVILLVAALAWYRRLAGTHLAFALCAICGLFTPVLGEYHLLIFVAPLFLLLYARPEAWSMGQLLRGSAWIFAVQLLCFAFWLVPVPAVLGVLVLVTLGFPLLVAWGGGGAEGRDDLVLAIACLAMLAPLGEELTNGLALALIGVSSLGWLLLRSLAGRGGRPIPAA